MDLLYEKMKVIYIFIFAAIFAFLPNVFSTEKSPEKPVAAVMKEDYPSVLNFGDVMFDRGVRNIMERRGRNPFQYAMEEMPVIKKYDVVIANLEGPIVETDRGKCQQKVYNFQFASTTPELLNTAGISMVNIANNHMYDCYGMGFESTKKYLEEAGISYIGDRKADKSFVVKIIDGKKIAFVGMDETVQPVPISNFYPLIAKLKMENDFIVVNIHWGTEYESQFNGKQKEIGHRLIDSGVNVVFGHHSHVVEPVEIYNAGVIFYSLGNFVFDQDGPETTKGIGAGVEFQKEKMAFTIYPYHIEIFAPKFLKGEEKESFCQNYLRFISHMSCKFEI